MNLRKALLLLVLSFGLAACGTNVIKPSQEGSAVEDRGQMGSADGSAATMGQGGQADSGQGASSSGVAGGAQFQGDPLDNPDSPLAQRVFYFGYDSSQVSGTDRMALDAHAAYLASNPELNVRVEGHADERGSREYNIGLGERRAQSVRRFLLFQGASSSQITVISYGEERPAALGHDESAWGQNRRVELVYP